MLTNSTLFCLVVVHFIATAGKVSTKEAK